jgi:hypothetical protein
MRREDDGKFTSMKRKIVGFSGVALLLCSIYLSKQGVGFDGGLWWMGLVVAISLTCAELMFNSSFDELSWTMVVLGFGAYIYSIYTNMVGFYFYRNSGVFDLINNFNATNVFGGLFMDVYPELAIAWALKESKVGDLLGNLIKTAKNPETLTKSLTTTTVSKDYTVVHRNGQGQARRQELEKSTPAPRAVPVTQKAYPTYHPAPKTHLDLPFDMDGEDGDE